jgi:eukaryotic-like serine/threonine-protein kinase
MIGQTVGHYRIVRPLGEGGMGLVYVAEDTKLDRRVAIKMLRAAGGDPTARERLWREARAAASVSHPNVCQLYEIGEAGGELFIAMELLEGEPLSARIGRGPVPLAETTTITLQLLAALATLHARGLIHRDLKPSNIFLTPHGCKLLDFGLSRAMDPPDATVTHVQLTQAGRIVGTPDYMSPEQARGEAVDARTDIFSLGVIVFEMLSGTRPFGGESTVDVLHRVIHEQPPALAGSPGIAALDRIVRKALAKPRGDRYPSAAAMAEDIRAVDARPDTGAPAEARRVTRLIVLPFRALRLDPDTDFLAFSLPDAITSSLSGLPSLVVRSTVAAARFTTDAPDLKALASDADIDAAVTGTLLRAGDELRVNAQLVEAPGGTVLWSRTLQVPLGDIFRLQDEITHEIVESLSIPLTAREQRLLRRDVPATAKAYEFYLRANQLAHDSQTWEVARDLYLECLAEDPRYAPAWARLGRLHRVLGKYFRSDPAEYLAKAEDAFARALSINPDLGAAHNYYAQLEVDLGRAQDAMGRLIRRVAHRSTDPELFAGLTHACRYCGLLSASLAADEHARRLDPAIQTSVPHTEFLRGDYARVAGRGMSDIPYIYLLSLAATSRTDDLVAAFRKLDESRAKVADFIAAARALIEGRRDDSVALLRRIAASKFSDPEGLLYVSRHFARLGEPDDALAMLKRSVEGGHFCYPALVRDSWFDGIRGDARFAALVEEARARHEDAIRTFRAAGGERVLGIADPV